MKLWRGLPGEHTELYSSIGVRPIDELTGLGPLGKMQMALDISDSSGEWHETDINAVVTASGVIAYVALERHAEVVGQMAQRYRFRLEADLYRPLYRTNSEGIEFDVYSYNDANPPPVIVSQAQKVLLVPSTNYPFPTYVVVLRGTVVDSIGDGVADVLVTEGSRERVLTDERGAFALPLRWAQKNVPISISAEDQRTGRTGMKTVVIPGDLGNNQYVTIA